jgi:type II secretory pathway component PulF
MEKQKSQLELFAAIRLEILLFLANMGVLFKLLIIQPGNMRQYKEIFMGMNVELTGLTKLLLNYSDFLMYNLVIRLFLAVVVIGLAFYGVNFLKNQAAQQNDEASLARMQVIATSALVISFILLQYVGSLVNSAMMLPMLKMVNAY